MSNLKSTEIRSIAYFNPSEKIKQGSVAKKIPMGCLKEFQRKISGFEFAEYRAGPKFRNGDVLLAKITPCLENGKTAFVDILEDDEVAFGSSEFIVLRAKSNAHNEYLYYLARSPAFRKRAIGCMEGTSGRKRVNEGVLKLYELPVPDKSVQIKIADVLSALDEKIELNNRISAELEAMAKTLYDHWHVQFDFPGANGKPYKTSGGKMIYNSTLKREIPEGWEARKIGQAALVKAGGDKPKIFSSFNSKEYPIPIFSNGISNEGLYGYTDIATIRQPSITVAARGTIGYSVLRLKPFVPIIRLIVLTPLEESALKYIGETIKRLGFDNSGSVQQQLTVPQISDINILYPSSGVLDSYSKIVTPIVNQLESLKEQNIELSHLRDWLLPMLMNGQVIVQTSKD